MKRIPFSLLPFNLLRRLSRIVIGPSRKISQLFPFLKISLKQIGGTLTPTEYTAMSIVANFFFFIFLLIITSIFLFLYKIEKWYLISISISVLISILIFFQQIAYPKLLANRRVKDIERNLLPLLQDLLVQLNSGIPLFDIFVNLARSDYGELSKEFEKAVKEINAGKPQVEALEELATNNPSLFFRRSLWQLINGLKAGSDMKITIEEIIRSLAEEQIIQIQSYGSQLNPLAMFYMLIAVIMPALAITFVTVISSFISASPFLTKIILITILVLLILFQIIFLGMIKTRRPNLLSS